MSMQACKYRISLAGSIERDPAGFNVALGPAPKMLSISTQSFRLADFVSVIYRIIQSRPVCGG